MTLTKADCSPSVAEQAELAPVCQSRSDIINYPNHFIDYDLTKRQRVLLLVSVFVTALLVTYFTEIRPNFKKTCFYWSMLHKVADFLTYVIMLLFRWA